MRTHPVFSLVVGTAVAVSTMLSPSVSAAQSATKPAAAATKAKAAKSATGKRTSTGQSKATDTTKKKLQGALGPQSGDRHLAFKGTGSDLDTLWPVKTAAPLPGSIFPAKRVLAYYGNPLSKRMGILGEFETSDMLAKLERDAAEWTRLDPAHPVQPALHLIAMVANPDPGPSGKYRTRMDSALIEKVYGWAKSKNALLFVDLQIGQSTLQQELPWIEKFLMRPDVHLGIDPEFSMKASGAVPGRRIGTYDAADINYAIRFLANVVDKYKLPPKILVVHRFTPKGVTNVRNIKLDPKVQFVMHMDGFGAPSLKRDTYYRDIKREPVQFTGWKQFTKAKNDKPPTTREAILRLWPAPLYIQVQ
ncbi:hypothetical protein [Gemmatimonas sp.]|jgi:hypothetical protein|uniref:hypothetical protein n=1 Tax=Gemmatimonas sp. TaxID=1962908 RepID=UPI0037BF3C49